MQSIPKLHMDRDFIFQGTNGWSNLASDLGCDKGLNLVTRLNLDTCSFMPRIFLLLCYVMLWFFLIDLGYV